MRILFSSTRETGHLRPLFPYLDAFFQRGHDVRVAAPESAAAMLGEAGFGHVIFGHPGEEKLRLSCAMVVASLTADQPDNARRLEATVAGLAVFEQDASTLRAALERVLEDAEMRKRAEEIADEMARSHSIYDAIDAMLSSCDRQS